MSALSKMKSLVTQTPWPKLSSSSHLLLSMAAKLTVPRDPRSSRFNPNLLRLKPTLSLRRFPLCSVQSRSLLTESATRPVSGEIHVIVGPMFAGKTTTLLRRVQSERSNGRFQVEPRINNLRPDKTLRALCISGRLKEAVSLLYRNTNGAQWDPKTYALLLQECIFTKDHRSGNRIHAQMIMSGFVPDEYLQTKLLIHYAKSGDLRTAHGLLDKMAGENSVSWNALISGYVTKGLEETGLSLYYKMRRSGVLPDRYTFASIFKACASLATLELGKQAHCVMIKCNIMGNIVVNSALLDMYLKGSSLSDAKLVFDRSPDKNVITWTSLISGYGLHGRFKEVLEFFTRMKSEGFRPNYVTFLSVLSACSHGGFVDEAWEYFSSMKRDYEIEPRPQHYAVMVNLLCRAGRVNEAYLFVLSSPCKDHSVIWGSLLDASKIHGDMELAKLAAEKYSELEPQNAGKFVVLSNAYAAFELWDDVAEVRSAMRKTGMAKEPAYSRIEIQREIHVFYKHDQSHKRSEQIYEMIKEITCVLKDFGYVPDLSAVNIAIIKSNKDTRYELDSIVTHDGMKLSCWAIADLLSFREKVGPETYEQLDVIGIDEAQFFDDLYDFCSEAADRDGKTVVVSGLDGDYLRRSFGSVLDIIPLADTVTKLSSRCELCGNRAFFTLRKTQETQTELIGGADVYMPVCRQHYVGGQVVIEATRVALESQVQSTSCV